LNYSAIFAQINQMNTRTKILDLAENLILERGFNAFSYQHLSDTIGIKKASIHYHFPTKDHLGKAVVERYRESFKLWKKKLEDENTKELDKLDAFFATYKNIVIQTDKICMPGILGAELNTLSEEMKEEMKLYFQERFNWLKQILADGLYSGAFHFIGNPEHQALLIISSLQGVMQIARTNQNPDYYYNMTTLLRQSLLKPSNRF
jgi:TetR/AcrR family transcriptional regulator, transcriptional repressor for nem operon